jgi:hypothetical protein
MLLRLQACPAFKRSLKDVLDKFPKSKKAIEKHITDLTINPEQGDIYPGFNQQIVRKTRVNLKEYNLSSKKGLRFIFLSLPDKGILLPLHIFKKGEYKQEQQVKKDIITKLRSILSEQQEAKCTESLF